MDKLKKISALMLTTLIVISLLAGCGGNGNADKGDGGKSEEAVRFDGPFSEKNGAFGGVDALGRVVPVTGESEESRGDKKVGIFYFLWQGQHGTGGPYDNYEIVKNDPDAIKSEKNWLKAGGGNVGEHHFWGEPLFGYYTSSDTWVFRKHCQMLTDAGVDFLVFDATNGYAYTDSFKKMLDVWYEYYEAGFDVPKFAFYTDTKSGQTVKTLYTTLYKAKKLHAKYPNMDDLWYKYDGKPLIIADSSDSAITQEMRDYFRIKESVWPNSGRTDDGFPWMEFGRLLSDAAVYGLNGRKEIVNVSIAQHSATCTMSYTAWYGANDRTRSWHDGKNDTSEDAILYGYNFQEQWDWAMSVDPETVFVTGWNEWVAQRQKTSDNRIIFVDCCDPNTSRDAEPMNGLFGDNYYLQLIENIRRYKGVADRVDVGDDKTIDVNGDFSQWDNAKAVYTDYAGDTADRKSTGFGNVKYRDESGRNDFTLLKTARDKENVYFYAETAENVQPGTAENPVSLFINSGINDREKWENQFDFRVDVVGDKATVLKFENGAFTACGESSLKIADNKIMLSVSRDVLGTGGLLNIQFKWADMYSAEDIFSFYTSGDAAPIGRLTYVFSETTEIK